MILKYGEKSHIPILKHGLTSHIKNDVNSHIKIGVNGHVTMWCKKTLKHGVYRLSSKLTCSIKMHKFMCYRIKKLCHD